MAQRLAFIHTSHVLIPLFSKLAKDILPGVDVFHMTDESLIRNTIAAGQLTRMTIRRVVTMIESAHLGGADTVMVTCSSIGAAVPVARQQFDFPILRVDEAMAETAIRMGKRIGVAATVRTTLEPTIALLRDTAAASHCSVEIEQELCEGAFEAVMSGDTARHDQLLTAGLRDLRKRSDVVVLAQASMVRVLPQLDLNGGPPILSSPELAVRSAAAICACQ
jgi:Asp/Glu/hydantoin racemase